MTTYEEFLASKAAVVVPTGIDDPGGLPPAMADFQRDIATWALKRGRSLVAADTGLGKTFMLLAWADAVCRETGRPVLIFAPLAVAWQIVGEAQKWAIDGVAYAADQTAVVTRIAVTNYDRLDKFDLDAFVGVVLDESGILKSVDSSTRRDLTERCEAIRFKLCCTATPAPNDYTEIGQHAEFLGVMSAKEMLAMYFVHDGSIRATNAGNHGGKPIAEWRLKGHAERAFWEWCATWMVMIRRPSDLGYSDDGYILPPLIKRQIVVPVDYAPSVDTGMLFPQHAITMQERLGARRDSIGARVAAAAEIIARDPNKPWLVWCGLNDESDQIARAVPGMVNVQGSDTSGFKERMALGFARGEPQKMVSKVAIVGRGMNYQHCADMIFLGMNDSFEQVYQAVRRCWRFGQTKPVTAWFITSEIEGNVVANVDAKEQADTAMRAAMAEHMLDLNRREIRGGRVASAVRPGTLKMEIPTWLTA